MFVCRVFKKIERRIYSNSMSLSTPLPLLLGPVTSSSSLWTAWKLVTLMFPRFAANYLLSFSPAVAPPALSKCGILGLQNSKFSPIYVSIYNTHLKHFSYHSARLPTTSWCNHDPCNFTPTCHYLSYLFSYFTLMTQTPQQEQKLIDCNNGSEVCWRLQW